MNYCTTIGGMSQDIETNEKQQYRFIFKKIGQNIRTLRQNKKMSQEELAFKVSTARNYIGCIERAEKFPSIITLYKISTALQIEFEKIFK